MPTQNRLSEHKARRGILAVSTLLLIQLMAADVNAHISQSDTGATSSSPGKPLVTAATGSKTQPLGTAIDSGNNVIVANHTAGTVSKYNSAGVLQWTTKGTIPTELVAIDQRDDIWVGEYQSATITEISDATGGVIGTGSTGSSGKYPGPLGMAFDTTGNLWMTVYNNYPTGPYWLEEMNQSRVVVSPSPYRSGYIGGSNLAIDGHGNIWVPGYGSSNTLTAFSMAGSVSTVITLANGPSSTFTLTNGSAVISGNNNFIFNQPIQLSTTGSLSGSGLSTGTTYYVSANGLTATQFELSATPAGSVITAAGTGSGTHSIYGTAAHADRAVIDRQGNIWLALTEYCEVAKYSPTGKLLATVSVDAGGTVGKQSSNSLAIDGANNLWVAGRRNSAVWEVSSTGTVYGHWTAPGVGALTSSVDQQGNVWFSAGTNNSISKVQGAGAGVKTPLVANLSQTP